jgi:hypothetical protein
VVVLTAGKGEWKAAGAPIRYFPDTGDHLGGVPRGGRDLPIKCRCGRRFGYVGYPTPEKIQGLVMTGLMVGTNKTVVRVGTKVKTPRPYMTFEEVELEDFPAGAGWWRCRAEKCGASWPRTAEQLVAAFANASRAGRKDLVFGDNL